MKLVYCMQSEDVASDVNGLDDILNEPSMNDEVSVKLTRGQLAIIKSILSEHIQPKGYEAIAFAYNLFSRLNKALEVNEWPSSSKKRGEPIASTRMGPVKSEDTE